MGIFRGLARSFPFHRMDGLLMLMSLNILANLIIAMGVKIGMG